jgi:hypothetical protein
MKTLNANEIKERNQWLLSLMTRLTMLEFLFLHEFDDAGFFRAAAQTFVQNFFA